MSDSTPKLTGVQLAIRYVPVSQVVKWDRNPKLHDIGGLVTSIVKHGFRDAPIFDGTLGAIVAGNGRAEALRQMEMGVEYDTPDGVAVDKDGDWYMPVQFGIDAPSIIAAEAFGVDHNNLTMTGGDLTIYDMARVWDEVDFTDLLTELAEAGEFPVTVDGDSLDALTAVLEKPPSLDDLLDEYGEPDESEEWPLISLRVPTATYLLYKQMLKDRDREPHEVFADMVKLAKEYDNAKEE